MTGLKTAARLYIATTVMAGLAMLAVHLGDGLPGSRVLLLVTCVAAAAAQIYKVEGATERSSYNLSLVVYGFALFFEGPAAAAMIVVVACVAEWAWHRYPWFIQSFNISVLILALAAGHAVYALVVDAQVLGSLHQLVAVILGTATFTAVNHVMVGLVIRLARGQSFSESGVFSKLTIVIDSTLFLMGGAAAVLWTVNPYTSVLALVPLYLIHTTLHVPALQRQAATDAKTGLYNARYFSEALQKELERADRFDRPLTVIMGDLDLLRNINNTYGHLAGDQVLIGVATIMKDSVREFDVVARFGGEEFAILMPETTLEQALPRMESIREAIESTDFEVPTSVTPIRTTMSFGIATRHRPGLTANQIVHEADLAVYRAKLSGRNRICLSDEEAGILGETESPPLEPLTPEADALLAGHTHEATTVTSHLAPQSIDSTPAAPDRTPTPSHGPRRAWVVTAYVWAIAAVAAAALFLAPLQRPEPMDWVGLFTISLVAVLVELLAIEVYAKDTSVSTSAAPFIAGVLLFGPAGALALSVLVAGSAMIKHRSPLSRFVFNSSVHLLAGVVIASIATAVPGGLQSWSPTMQAAVVLTCALVLFFITSISVTEAIHLSTGEAFWRLWRDRFRWLAPYYLGLGLVGYAIIFSHLAAGSQGVAVVLVPLLLLRLGQKQYIDRTRGIVNQLRGTNAELQKRSDEISELSEELLVVLSKTVDLRDPYTAGHSEQVSRYASLIADEMGLTPERVDLVRKAGLLHDIGKLGVPETILRKPGRLTAQEYEQVKKHSSWGAHLLGESRAMRRLVPFLRHHHERYDGTGYPDGLVGREIPLEARILAVADAVDAMGSDRSYRSALDAETIVGELLRFSGTQFDPSVVASFQRIVLRQGAGMIVNSAETVLARYDEDFAITDDGLEGSDRVVQLVPRWSTTGT